MTTSALLSRPFRSVLSSFRRRSFTWALGAAGLLSTSLAAAQTKAYDIPLLEKVTFKQPTNMWSYFFEIRPGVQLAQSQFVELNYQCSPTLLQGQGNLTVMLNDAPVDSKKIGGNQGDHGVWRVNLPLSLFKPEFNELKIVSRQRSIAGPCQDDENRSNWIRFGDGTRLHLQRQEPMVFPLQTYPFPFLDTLAVNPVQATWILPNGVQPPLVAEALGLASDWGRYEQTRGLPIRIELGRMVAGQNVVLGNLPQQSTAGVQGPGFIQAYPGDTPGTSRLWITGTTDEGIHAARKTLAFPEMVGQLQGTKTVVQTEGVDELRTPTTRLGTFTFSELGTPAFVMSGAYSQHATITIQRPVRVDLGRDSFLTIRFRHAENLNPLRSILTVKVNGLPVGSARLDNTNGNGGFIKVRIPITELAKNIWQVDLEAYHDLAAVDCSKTYEDVAWTVILGDSSLDLSTGRLVGHPYLDAFPYLVGGDGIAQQRCAISFSPNPSATQLSLGAVIAARSSQANRHSFDWDVTYGNLPDSKASSIVVGTYDEVQRFAPIAKALLIAPKGNGDFDINGKIRIVKDALKGGAVLQAVRSPDSQTSVMYVLLGADDAALQRFANLLADPKRAIALTGEVAVMSADGKVTTLSTVSDADATENRLHEGDRYTPMMLGVLGGIIVVLLIGIYVFARSFVKRTPKTTGI